MPNPQFVSSIPCILSHKVSNFENKKLQSNLKNPYKTYIYFSIYFSRSMSKNITLNSKTIMQNAIINQVIKPFISPT